MRRRLTDIVWLLLLVKLSGCKQVQCAPLQNSSPDSTTTTARKQTRTTSITNEVLFLDMIHNNPGDPVAWQQSQFINPQVLAQLGYNGQATSGEMSGTLAIDFNSLGVDLFPEGSPARAWLNAHAAGVERFVQRASATSSVYPFFHVDLLVFPTPLLEAFPRATNATTGRVLWNNTTRFLTRVLIRETVAKFPTVQGWIVRTGETYTFDTPFHVGNSPTAEFHTDNHHYSVMDIWVDFISFLRDELCEKHHKRLLFRAWDNWPSNAAYYLNLTNQITPHPLLYFSIKHTPADFMRGTFGGFNPTLGIGKHAQIVEVQLQREYEGKQAYPNYIVDGVIDGFHDDNDDEVFDSVITTTNINTTSNERKGLSFLLNKPQFKGVYTWSRGGGWWGPYLHGNEDWVELHVRVLALWFHSHVNLHANTTGGSNATTGLSEGQAFQQACEAMFAGCTVANGCCAAMRNVTQSAARSVLHGKWGILDPPPSPLWIRDDRIGGLSFVKNHFQHVATSSLLFQASLAEKHWAFQNFVALEQTFTQHVAPYLTDPMQRDRLFATVEYGVHLYRIIDASWRAMAQGYLKELQLQPHLLPSTTTSTADDSPSYNPVALAKAIADYDAAWAGYRAFGLANILAPSLFHPYYLCLGTQCNCAFDPLDPGDAPWGKGIGETIDRLKTYDINAIAMK